MKPFVKRQKNDMADAEAICEAAQRPTMRFVAVKSEAKQASAVIFRTRDLLVGQRTQITNALRGQLAEYGFIAPQGLSHVERLIAEVEDPASGLPDAARSCSSGPKTTGGKGLHVMAPIAPGMDWRSAKAFTKRIAEQVPATAPERYTTSAALAKRPGRLFMDYFRNGRGTTAFGPIRLVRGRLPRSRAPSPGERLRTGSRRTRSRSTTSTVKGQSVAEPGDVLRSRIGRETGVALGSDLTLTEGEAIQARTYMAHFPSVEEGREAAREFAEAGLGTVSKSGSIKLSADGAREAKQS